MVSRPGIETLNQGAARAECFEIAESVAATPHANGMIYVERGRTIHFQGRFNRGGVPLFEVEENGVRLTFDTYDNERPTLVDGPHLLDIRTGWFALLATMRLLEEGAEPIIR